MSEIKRMGVIAAYCITVCKVPASLNTACHRPEKINFLKTKKAGVIRLPPGGTLSNQMLSILKNLSGY